jgi:hypothetical protein
MATSPNYDLFTTGLDPKPRRTFVASGYISKGVNDNVQRTLWPHVLGYKKKEGTVNEVPEKERVLCWQLEGSSTVPEWRCYHAKDLVGLAVSTATWQMGTEYSKHQNCVRNEKFQVPYPAE